LNFEYRSAVCVFFFRRDRLDIATYNHGRFIFRRYSAEKATFCHSMRIIATSAEYRRISFLRYERSD